MLPPKKATKINPNAALVAEQILQGMNPRDDKPKLSPVHSGRATNFNIKNVKVPESMVESILGFATGKEEQPVERVDEAVVVENKISDLVKRLSSLLVEAKQVLAEMCTGTTTGMLATNTAKKKKVIKRKP